MDYYGLSLHNFTLVVKLSNSKLEIMRRLKMRSSGPSYERLVKLVRHAGLDLNHFPKKRLSGVPSKRRDLSELLVKSPYVSSSLTWLKERLFQEGVLEEKCYECEMPAEWRGKHLALHMDHINGDRADNRIENLRILCPNCHSQTDTFAGRSKRKKRKERPVVERAGAERRRAGKPKVRQEYSRPRAACGDCGCSVWETSLRCNRCAGERRFRKKTKIDWPSDEWLLKELENRSCLDLSRELGVSYPAIRKRLEKVGKWVPRRKK